MAGIAAWILRRAFNARQPKPEARPVASIQTGVAMLEAAVLEIKTALLSADIPGMKAAVATHDGSIRVLNADVQRIDADVKDVRREADEAGSIQRDHESRLRRLERGR